MANRPRILTSIRRRPRELKEAVADLIAAFPNVEVAAKYCRSRPSTLSGYANPNQEGRSIPTDVVLALESKLRQPIVTKFVAQKLGYELYRLPTTKDDDPLGRRIRRIVREGSKVFTAAADALEDGKVTPDEAAALIVGVNQAIAAFVDLSKGLEDILQTQKTVHKRTRSFG